MQQPLNELPNSYQKRCDEYRGCIYQDDCIYSKRFLVTLPLNGYVSWPLSNYCVVVKLIVLLGIRWVDFLRLRL